MSGGDTDGSPEGVDEDSGRKKSEYFASKGDGGHYEDGEGGHARRRLEEMIAQRFPSGTGSEEETVEGTDSPPPTAASEDSALHGERGEEGASGEERDG